MPATASNLRHITDHMAAVLEAAGRERRRGATQCDNLMDCHGYRMADNLNPAPMLALMKMVNQPYRDCLRTAIVVDAPRSFSMLWRAAAPLLSEKTRKKVRFFSREEAVEFIRSTSGPKAAAAVERVMALNRTRDGCTGSSFPSEVEESDDEEREEPERGPIWRSITRSLTRSLTRRSLKTSAAGVAQRTLLSRLFCCRRRRSQQGLESTKCPQRGSQATPRRCALQRRKVVTFHQAS